MGFCPPFGDSFIQISVQVCFIEDGIDDINRRIAILVSTCTDRLVLHEPGVFDTLLSQAELKHLDPADEVLVDILLRL